MSWRLTLVPQLLVLSLMGCGQYLQQFSDEDKDIQLTVSSETSASPTFNPNTRIVAFTVDFSMDRAGSYRILHATTCSSTRTSGGMSTTGSLIKNTVVSATIQLTYDDVLLYGKNVILCVQDTAAYKTSSRSFTFAAGLSTVLASSVTAFNESYGGGGGNMNSNVSAEYFLFQTSWIGVTANRGNGTGGPFAADGVYTPYSHAVYIDVNDAYKLKYFVVDRDNHRVLIFNQVPTSNSASADVVVGQANFTAASANSGAAIGAQGFNQPVHASVNAAGILFICDFNNNRVLGYNTIPTTNGVTASFVLGQSGMATGTANVYGNTDARSLTGPFATHAISGKLYILDQSNARIVVHNTTPTSTGATPDFVIGQADFTSITSSGADYRAANGNKSDYLKTPNDLLIHQSKLYISDSGYHRVLVFNTIPTISDQRPSYVIGQANATGVSANQGAGSTPAANTLRAPTTIVAQDNKLAIADQLNNRVVFYDLPIAADNKAAAQVLGQSNSLITSTAGTTQGMFTAPAVAGKGLIFDNSYIWTIDGGNNRVQILKLPY
jgi:hypothetical protein